MKELFQKEKDKYNLTPKQLSHFHLFRAKVLYYMDILNLNNYRSFFNIQEKPGVRASVYFVEDSHIASFCMSIEWLREDHIQTEDIEQTAFHEVIEVLLCQVRYIMSNRETFFSEHIIEKEIHSIIRTMENCILPRIK